METRVSRCVQFITRQKLKERWRGEQEGEEGRRLECSVKGCAGRQEGREVIGEEGQKEERKYDKEE